MGILSAAESFEDFSSGRVLTAKSRTQRRIVLEISELGNCSGRIGREAMQSAESAGDRDRCSIQKVPSGNGAIHSQACFDLGHLLARLFRFRLLHCTYLM